MAEEEHDLITMEYGMTEEGTPTQTIVVHDNSALRKLMGVSMGWMQSKDANDNDGPEFPTMLLTHIPMEHDHDDEGNCMVTSIPDEEIKRDVWVLTHDSCQELVSQGISMLVGGDENAAKAVLAILAHIMQIKHNAEEHGAPDAECTCQDDKEDE